MQKKNSCQHETINPSHHQNAMNLRNVTIWTTGVMTAVSIATPIVFFVYFLWRMEEFSDVNKLFSLSGLIGLGCWWLFSGSPLLVSFLIALLVKKRISIVVLLVATTVYGILFACVWGLMFIFPAPIVMILAGGIGIAMLPIMLPAWIVALVLNSYYTKKPLVDSENQSDK